MASSRNRCTLGTLAAGLLVALPGTSDRSWAAQTDTKPELVIETALARDRLRGWYRSRGTGLRFDVRRIEAGLMESQENRQLLLADLSGSPLLEVSNTPATKTVRAKLHRQAVSIEIVDGKLTAPEGKAKAVSGLLASAPELALLPELSRALGERGLNGADYPITLSLHVMALGVDGLRRMGRPSRPRPAPPATNIRPACIRAPATTSSCRDVRAGVSCAPVDCLGMCGPGCDECWSWVCGDCCATDGCYWHDVACSGMLSYADPACIFGVLAAFDCDRRNWLRNTTNSSDGTAGAACVSPAECQQGLWCLGGTCRTPAGEPCRGAGPRDCIDGICMAAQNVGTHVDTLGRCEPGGYQPGNLPANALCLCFAY